MFHIQINKEKARDTGLALTLALLLLEVWLGGGLFLKFAVGTLLLSMTIPAVFRPAAFVWFGFAHIVGIISSKVILFLVFFVMVIPVGLFRKMMGKDSLQLTKWKKGRDSVFYQRDHLFTAKDLEKPY